MGARGKKPKLETVWDIAERQGLSVVLHQEGDWQNLEGDIHVFRLDSMADKLIANDLAGAQESLNSLAEVIDHTTVPYLIVSAYGVTEYSVCLNIDQLLLVRGLMVMNGRGGVLYDKTYAYPADYSGRKPRDAYGIFINTQAREQGFLELNDALSIEGEILVQLNQVDGIEAMSAHRVYDIGGRYFSELPDIVFRSNGRTHFRSTGDTELDVITPFGSIAPSSVGMIGSKNEEWLRGINSVTDVRKAILRALKEVNSE